MNFYSKEKIFALLQFIDYILKLPKEEEKIFMEELIKSEGLKSLGKSIDFPNYREVIFEEGMEKGREEGKFEVIKNLLDIIDIKILSERTGLSIEVLQNLKNS